MAITKTKIDKSKGIAFVFDLIFLDVRLSAQGTKTLIYDHGTDKARALPADSINPTIQLNGNIQTDAAIAQLIEKSPDVQKFIDLIMDKALEDYSFIEDTTAARIATGKTESLA